MQNVFLCKEDISKVKFATQFAWTCNTLQSYAKHGLIWGISLMHPGPPFFSWHFIAASLMASPSLAHLSLMQSCCLGLRSAQMCPLILSLLGVGGFAVVAPFDGETDVDGSAVDAAVAVATKRPAASTMIWNFIWKKNWN